ncbi:MAG: ABC transporter substrate-binding protein [Clostridiales bacterium]|nr:ABC transporter substrate-binding protein [Clostridiales bacterium]MBR4948101.1 ABC transporter substrate-binding protein [Clostridiales bacterium]
MKRFFSLILCMALAINIAGCSGKKEQPQDKDLYVIGFSQVGSESDWRLANTKSMVDTFTEDKGYELRMENAKQRQDNQFAAVRTFILEGVDCIVIAPTVEEGWDTILKEIQDAGIPVIIMDRSVSVDDKNLYLTNYGSDFLEQGNMAVRWLEKETSGLSADENLRILHLQGTYGATAQLLRTKALEVAVTQHDNWEFAAQLYGDFTEAKAYEVVTDYLKTDKDIDVIYSENDNMTYGAMRALEDAGISYGKNGQVKIISFDATKRALQYCLEGKIDLCVECNPLHGPGVEELITKYRNGEEIPKHVYVEETAFTSADLTQDFIDSREY